MYPITYQTPLPNIQGKLSIMAKPTGGEWLGDSIHGLKQLGIDRGLPVTVKAITLAQQLCAEIKLGKHFVILSSRNWAYWHNGNCGFSCYQTSHHEHD